MRQLYAYDVNDANELTGRLVEGGMSTWWARGSSPDVSLDFVSGNIKTLGKTKRTGFPRDLTLSVLLFL